MHFPIHSVCIMCMCVCGYVGYTMTILLSLVNFCFIKIFFPDLIDKRKTPTYSLVRNLHFY